MVNIDIPTTLEIKETPSQIEKAILQGFRDALNIAIPKAIPGIHTGIRNIIRAEIEASNEYTALISGPLDAHFGFPQGTATRRIDAIINIFENQINIRHIKVATRGKNLTGGLIIGAIISDFLEAMALPESHVVYMRTIRAGGHIVSRAPEDLPWLEWFLIRGDEIIISDYEIDFQTNKNSRSGEAVMQEKTGSVWRVPPGVSGTSKSNWITRVFALTKRLDIIITKVVQANLQKALS